MPPALPLSIRIPLAIQRRRLLPRRFARLLLEDFTWAWTPPADRDAVTAAIYAGLRAYLPGGRYFDGGLFSWEEQALARPEWPRAGRVLLAGAGAGRELRVLGQRGYTVRAFEPVPALARACVAESAALPGSSCTQGSYADLLSGTAHGQGPLASVAREAPFDAVLLGWGSLAHVTEPGRVDEVLGAVRTLCPRGPLLTSFYTVESVASAEGGDWVAPGLPGRLFSALGAPGRRPPGGAFVPWAGFILTHRPDSFRELLRRHGYRVVASSAALPQPWALALPG